MKKDFVVMATGERPLEELAQDLRGRGLAVDHVLHELGMITGAAEETTAETLRRVRGVSDVSVNIGADIGPPGKNPA